MHGCRHTPCHGLCAEVRGQPECWSSSATLFETGCLLFTPACARLADLKASRDSPVSASHCWWECWHCRCVYCHVLISVGLIGSNSYPHIAHQALWPSEPTLQPWASFLTGSWTAQIWQIMFQFLFNSKYFLISFKISPLTYGLYSSNKRIMDKEVVGCIHNGLFKPLKKIHHLQENGYQIII